MTSAFDLVEAAVAAACSNPKNYWLGRVEACYPPTKGDACGHLERMILRDARLAAVLFERDPELSLSDHAEQLVEARWDAPDVTAVRNQRYLAAVERLHERARRTPARCSCD